MNEVMETAIREAAASARPWILSPSAAELLAGRMLYAALPILLASLAARIETLGTQRALQTVDHAAEAVRDFAAEVLA